LNYKQKKDSNRKEISFVGTQLIITLKEEKFSDKTSDK